MKQAAAMVVLCSLLAACGNGRGDRVSARIDTGAAPIDLEVEIADSEDERRRGLMHREFLQDRAGMLFVHDEDTDRGFWMKDTLVPLSIAFIDSDGRILEILDMEPCARDPCPLYRPGAPYRLALEVNRGAFARWDVEVGDVFRLT
jgi:uncharacterized membrane protein (UPF0127 family)